MVAASIETTGTDLRGCERIPGTRTYLARAEDLGLRNRSFPEQLLSPDGEWDRLRRDQSEALYRERGGLGRTLRVRDERPLRGVALSDRAR